MIRPVKGFEGVVIGNPEVFAAGGGVEVGSLLPSMFAI